MNTGTTQAPGNQLNWSLIIEQGGKEVLGEIYLHLGIILLLENIEEQVQCCLILYHYLLELKAINQPIINFLHMIQCPALIMQPNQCTDL